MMRRGGALHNGCTCNDSGVAITLCSAELNRHVQCMALINQVLSVGHAYPLLVPHHPLRQLFTIARFRRLGYRA